MTEYKLLKILNSTFPDVEFDVFTDTEGLVRVNFVVDKKEDWKKEKKKEVADFFGGEVNDKV
jgi:hypothetical protein